MPLLSDGRLKIFFFVIEIFLLNKTSGGDSYCPNYYSVLLRRPVTSLVAVVKMVLDESLFGVSTSSHQELESVYPLREQFQGKEVKADSGEKSCNCFR